MSKTVISVENLTKRYDLGVIGTGTLSRDLNRWWARLRGKPNPYTRIGQEDTFNRRDESILALDNVSFTVPQGEALGIIGKNGAGKSTLLKILSRVTAPTSGTVKVRGRIGSLLEVGTGFHPELTGRENVFLNGAILGMRKDEVDQKFDEIVDFSGVEKFIDTPVKRYSSGMYVRLAFAVAAHLDPEILVIDEVLAVGDAEFQKKCLGKMGDVASEGRTVLFVSHNMGAIRNLCTKGILLHNGKMEYKGSSEDCILNYMETSLLNIGEPIISHITKNDPNIKITNFKVNNQTSDVIRLSPSDKTLTIEIDGYIKIPARMGIEFRLCDQYDYVLAFFSPGHLKQKVNLFDPGNFSLKQTAILPNGIQKGNYSLDIFITDPNNYGWVDLPNAVNIQHDGVASKKNITISRDSKSGWLLLESQNTINNND